MTRAALPLMALLFAVVLALVPLPVVAAGGFGGGVGSGVEGGVGGAVGEGAGDGPTGYVPPVPGVDPPDGVVRGFDPPAERWAAGHRGVDLLSAAGATVVSPGTGVVTFAGRVAGRGVLVVAHPDGLRSSLEPVVPRVGVGDPVSAGTPVGVVEGGGIVGDLPGGPVGGASASHCPPDACVHWGVRRGERYLDPLTLLERPVIVLLPVG